MSPEREYSKLYYCLTCKKYLSKDFFDSHKSLGHKAESYISMPKNVEKRIQNTGNPGNNENTQIPVIKQEIRADYADLSEEDPELEFEG